VSNNKGSTVIIVTSALHLSSNAHQDHAHLRRRKSSSNCETRRCNSCNDGDNGANEVEKKERTCEAAGVSSGRESDIVSLLQAQQVEKQ